MGLPRMVELRLPSTLGIDDCQVEAQLLPFGSEHVFVLSGGGARVVPLLARGPRMLSVCDVSREHLWFAEMRLAALRLLSYETYLGFLGYPGTDMPPDERRKCFLALPLGGDGRDFLVEKFEIMAWNAPLYWGNLERSLIALSRAGRTLLREEVVNGLFRCERLEEQEEFISTCFVPGRWRLFVRAVGATAFVESLFKRMALPRMRQDKGFYLTLQEGLDRCLRLEPAHRNFFLHLLLLGELRDSRGWPPEAQRETFSAAKKHLEHCKIQFIQAPSLEELVGLVPGPFSFVALGDFPSRLKPIQESTWLQTVRSGARDEAMVVVRYFHHVPGPVDTTGMANLNHRFPEIFKTDKTQLFTFDVFQKIG